MRKILFGTTAMLLSLAALGTIAPQRAEAGFPPKAEDVVNLLKQAINTAKDKAKNIRFAPGSLEVAQRIVTDGIVGTPKAETTPGKKFPHFLVTTKKGATYKVKFKKDDVLGRKITITVSKPDAPEGPEDAPPMK
jgi:hypothetical protein